MELSKLLEQGILYLDGAMGTQLQRRGLKPGESPELLCITSPDVVREIHAAYYAAGSQIVLTNTLGASRKKLKRSGYSPEQVIDAAVKVAKEAAAPYGGYVALDIGPLGEMLEPMGTLAFEEAYELFREQMVQGEKSGADLIFIETMSDLYEVKAALLAAKENTSLPVFCTMTFEASMRTFTGCGISNMALTLQGLGADAIGVNCSLGPVEVFPVIEELAKWTNLPIIVKPNAGLPKLSGGAHTYDLTPEDFAKHMEKFLSLGAAILGGCCGTDDRHIRQLRESLSGKLPVPREQVSVSAVCSATGTVGVDRVRIIGERINPTGKKLFKKALREGDIDYLVGQGIDQVRSGASILDVNVGLPGIDEKAVMVEAVKRLQEVLHAPLQIDSADPEVIEAALRIYNGKAIVNSVNGEEEKLRAVLPVVKKYGAAVVGLTMDEKGIPETAEERFYIAQKIVNAAAECGIPKEDVYIDCLTLSAGAEQAIAAESLKALSLVKQHLGVKTLLGVSNISFGLPARETVNHTFLVMALAAGLDLPIINPGVKELIDAIYSYNLLTNVDKGAEQFVTRFAQDVKPAKTEESAAGDKADIGYAISKGLKNEAKECCRLLLAETDALTIVNTRLIPALDLVGARYEKGEIFLPQLILSAEAAKAAFEVIKETLGSEHASASKGKIVLATVKGDIHDIGKNIVKVVLENYGYDIVDLGRDVAPEAVASAVKHHGAKLVGLSSLMTTTLKSMEKTITELRAQNLDCKVVVGGAVLTEDYAKRIGADFYAKDAQSAVSIARSLFDVQ